MDSRSVRANMLTVFLFSGLYDYKGFLAALFIILYFSAFYIGHDYLTWGTHNSEIHRDRK